MPLTFSSTCSSPRVGILLFFCTCSSLLFKMLFSPAVGPLLSTRRGSALLYPLVTGIIQSGHVYPDCWLHFELCSLPGVAACQCVSLAPRAPNSHRLRSVPVSRIPSRLHVLTHVFDSACSLACCSWSGSPQPHRLTPPRAARAEVSSRARVLWLVVALLGMVAHVLLLSTHPRTLRVVCWTDQHHSLPPPGAERGGVRLQNRGSDSSLHVAILLWSAHREGLSADAIVTPELGCSGSREHSSSCSGGQPEYGCDRASRVPLGPIPALDAHVATPRESAAECGAIVVCVFPLRPPGCTPAEAQ